MNVELYGGPADGRLMTVPDEFGWTLNVAVPRPIQWRDPVPDLDDLMPVDTFTYRLDGIKDDGTRRFVLA